MEGAKTLTGITGDFKEEKNETKKPGQKLFPESQRLWQSNGLESVNKLKFRR